MAAMMMLAANIPDIDAYPFFTSQVDYIDIHRGITHALVMAPVMALLPIAIVKGWTRTRPSLLAFIVTWLACTLSVFSHLALDWTNVYDIRMLLPFAPTWLRLDITNVVDPIIWALLILCLGLPSLLGLVGSEMGAKKTGGKRGLAWMALLLLTAYEGLRWTSHEKALSSMNALLYRDAPAKHVYAFPDGLGLLRWRGVVEGDGFFYEMPVDARGNFSMRDAKLLYKAAPNAAARATRTFQVFESFNQVPLWRVSALEDRTLVELVDLRLNFSTSAIIEPNGEATKVRFGFGRP
jgi:inner membrane protein